MLYAKKKLKIAIIFKPYRPLKIPFTGGMMYYVYFLAKGLADRGHQVTVMAGQDAKLPNNVKLIKAKYDKDKMDVYHAHDEFYEDIFKNCKSPREIINRSFGELAGRFDKKIEIYLQYLTLAHNGKFDVIHVVTHDILALYPALFLSVPTVVSFHGHYKILGDDFLAWLKFIKKNKLRHNCNFVSVSKYIQKEYGCFVKSKLIYNSIDIAPYKLNTGQRDDYLIWIGRIDYNKGLDRAVQIALKLKQKLYFAGPIENQYLFDTKIKPYIDNKNIKYLGILNEQQKNKYISRAKAMFFPTRGEEAFGRVAVESLACGTPVITYDKGGLSEIVVNKKTGFIIRENNLADVKRALANLNKIKPEVCRKFVEKNFILGKMIGEYEKFYQRCVKN